MHPTYRAWPLEHVGALVSRYGLALVLAWFGLGKYVKMEARVLIEHSPLMSWVYDYAAAPTVARALGSVETIAALLLAVRPWWPRASAVGSAAAIVPFLLTDVVLLGVAIWTLGDALRAVNSRACRVRR